MHSREILDVEDHDTRQHRIQSTLQKLNSSSPTKADVESHKFDFGERRTCAVEPPSELLSRVQTFLPQIEASNAILAQRVQADPRSVDIEALEENDTQVIEMNLGLGVFQNRSNEDSDESMPSASSSDDSSTSSESSDSDEISP